MRDRTTAAAVTLFMAAGVIACSGDRNRPSASDGTGPTGSVQLQAEVLNPQTNQTDPLYASRPATIKVKASEASGQLFGVGYVMRRTGPNRRTVDSAAVKFGATGDTIIPFPLTMPATLPHNTNLDIFGIAFGPGTLAVRSLPETVVVRECPDNVDYC